MTSTIESNDSIKNVSIKDTKVMSVEERLEDISVRRDIVENLKKVVDYIPYQNGASGYKCVPKNWDDIKDVLINDDKVKESLYLAVLLSVKTNKNKAISKRENFFVSPNALYEIGLRAMKLLLKKESELVKSQNTSNKSSVKVNNSNKSGKSEFELLIANDVYINVRKSKLAIGVGNAQQLNAEIEARIDELAAKYMAEHPEA